MDFFWLREIEEFPGALISMNGDVYRNWKKKKTPVAKNGYPIAVFSVNNRSNSRYVHRMILEAFVGKCPPQHEALHKNGIRTDSRLENLRWGTKKENFIDAIKHGTATIGTNNKQASFNKEQIKNIVEKQRKGMKKSEIAKEFGVSRSTIYSLFSGKTYKGELND